MIMATQDTTKQTHTPGPWHMRTGVCRNDHPDTSADVHGADGQFIADCGCHESANANASRIVLAVNAHDDLLAALKQAVADARPATNPSSRMPSYEQACAAIAKAEGR